MGGYCYIIQKVESNNVKNWRERARLPSDDPKKRDAMSIARDKKDQSESVVDADANLSAKRRR